MHKVSFESIERRDCEGVLLLFENAKKAWSRTGDSRKAEKAEEMYDHFDEIYSKTPPNKRVSVEVPCFSPEFIQEAYEKADWWMFDVRSFSASKRGKMKRGYNCLRKNYR